jgi:beta-glucanase (GH16 family)
MVFKMKKIVLLLLLVFTLTGCELITENPDQDPTCFTGFSLVDGKCVKDEEPVIDNSNNPDADLDNENCTHLDPIDQYEPVWCDEFNYTGLPDDDKWNYDVGGHGWGNGESQYYTNKDLDNASVENGYLYITARQESIGNNQYSSARLVTKNKADWLYGKIQVRAKLPTGRGMWPAIWMLPTNWEYGGWPESGEIDIMEYVGYDPTRVHSTIHTGAYNHSLNTQIGFSKYGTTWDEEFHVYEIEWEPGIIRAYVDGELYATFTYDPDESEGMEPHMAWPFDKEFHLILNIAVGGAWGGVQGIDESIFPQEMIVDYVRVYQIDYAKDDTTNPMQVTNVEATNILPNSAFLKWDHGMDNAAVEHYEIYVNGTYLTNATLNGFILEDLDASTNYDIGIIAVDFAGNSSVAGTTSFTTAAPILITDRIEAELYTTQSGIQTEDGTNTSGTGNIGWTDPGDYVSYQVNVENPGTYRVHFRVASGTSGGTLRLKNGTETLTEVSFGGTGGWQSWITQTATQEIVFSTAGEYTLTIEFVTSGTNLDYFIFEEVND